MTFVPSLLRRLDHARQNVPKWARFVVIFLAFGLTLATWAHLPLAGLGLELPAWESLVFDTCQPFCHQYPARSFQIAGHGFPLCARCTGMWLGITLGVAFAMVVVPRHRWWIGVIVAVLATAASGFDFLRESSGGTPHAITRCVLGFILFFGVTLAVSFDTLAVLAELGRLIRRLHRGK